MKVLAAYSIKGGVGKTASAVNIAYESARNGFRTLICDLDPQGAVGFYFRISPAEKLKAKKFVTDRQRLFDSIRGSDFERLDVLPAHRSFRNMDLVLDDMKKSKKQLDRTVHSLKDQYDVVVLDCPPNISLLSENIFVASDLIFVPVIPTTLSDRTYAQLCGFFKDHEYRRKKLCPFFSMVERRKRLHRDTITNLCERYSTFLKPQIPYSVDIENMGIQRKPVHAYAPNSEAAGAFHELWQELKSRIGLEDQKAMQAWQI